MTGRKGLTWVTALTVASLLLGGGAINALADGRGGGDHGGGGKGKPEHQQPQQQQQQQPAVVTQATHGDGDRHDNNNVNRNDDNDNRDNNVNVNRKKDDDADEVVNEDLVTPPERVTDEDRPGLGCGDDNHVHTGPPGNPDKECKRDDDGKGLDDDDANAAGTVAGADDQVMAIVDDRDGN